MVVFQLQARPFLLRDVRGEKAFILKSLFVLIGRKGFFVSTYSSIRKDDTMIRFIRYLRSFEYLSEALYAIILGVVLMAVTFTILWFVPGVTFFPQ